jgi:iron-sulfur cluster assembly accessory protein
LTCINIPDIIDPYYIINDFGEKIMLETNVETSTITLTPAAIQAVKNLLEEKNLTGYALRIFISGGGCSGFQYGMAFEGKVRPEDTTFEMEGIQVVVDEMSINYLNGSIVDFINDPSGAGFKIENPNIVSGCNCGSSYSSGEKDGCGTNGCCGS